MAHSETDTGRQRSLLVVAGSGRSGTSLMASLAGRLGLLVPQPEVKANKSNPSGFGEPRWAVDFHDGLLKSVAVTREDARPEALELAHRVAERPKARARLRGWLEEQFSQSDRVVIKDPRLAWFLELYRVVADEISVDLSVVTMLRDPAESVRSRQLAYTSKIEATTRMAGWLNVMLSVEVASRELPRAIVSYEDLLSQWQATLTAAEKVLPLQLLGAATHEQIQAADELVDPSLRRASPDWDELDLPAQLRELAERAYEALNAMRVAPEGGAPSASPELIDATRELYARYYQDSEYVVRSSITAARTAERRRVTKEQEDQAVSGATVSRATPEVRASSTQTVRSALGRVKDGTLRLIRRLRG